MCFNTHTHTHSHTHTLTHTHRIQKSLLISTTDITPSRFAMVRHSPSATTSQPSRPLWTGGPRASSPPSRTRSVCVGVSGCASVNTATTNDYTNTDPLPLPSPRSSLLSYPTPLFTHSSTSTSPPPSPSPLGSVWVLLGLLCHWLSGGPAFQCHWEAGLPQRTEPCGLLQ